jgi:oxygen-dependent protoporphyrinogen oxidase
MHLDDATLVERLHEELSEAVGMTAPPAATRVARWPRSFPQYAVGHLDRVATIEAALAAAAPGVVPAGAAYRGVGIPACIAQAATAASRVSETG